jgi:hypothetical protein
MLSEHEPAPDSGGKALLIAIGLALAVLVLGGAMIVLFLGGRGGAVEAARARAREEAAVAKQRSAAAALARGQDTRQHGDPVGPGLSGNVGADGPTTRPGGGGITIREPASPTAADAREAVRKVAAHRWWRKKMAAADVEKLAGVLVGMNSGQRLIVDDQGRHHISTNELFDRDDPELLEVSKLAERRIQIPLTAHRKSLTREQAILLLAEKLDEGDFNPDK